MSKLYKNNIFTLFVQDLILTTNWNSFKEHMIERHGFSEETYVLYKDIFFEQLNKIKNDNMGVLVNGEEGWVCPKCDRALSPKITVCPYCNTENPDNNKPNFEDLNMNPYKDLNPLNS